MFAWIRRARLGRLGLAALAGLVLLLGARVLLVCHPDALFSYAVVRGNLRIASDVPIPEEAAREVLDRARRKLERSTLWAPALTHRIYVCNQLWRQWLFLQGRAVGGLNYHPLARHVFLRGARFYDNRLLSPRGWPIGGGRTLDYYVAHEIAHTLVGERAGGRRIPLWLNEGYADRIGMGPEFDLEAAREALRSRPPETGAMAEEYLRYDVMVAYLMDAEGRAIEDLLECPPEEGEVRRAAGL